MFHSHLLENEIAQQMISFFRSVVNDYILHPYILHRKLSSIGEYASY